MLSTLENTSLSIVQIWNICIGLIGGLALFLYGIEKMSDGLRAVAGDRLKTLLAKLTSNRFLGVLTGASVTAVIQSSSLTTVLVVGFISAGLMTLQQSVGIILGANIGTTLTMQLAAFKITDSAWLLVALGFASFAFGKRDAARQLGSVLMGLGLLFLALEKMTQATGPLRKYEPFLRLMSRLENPILGIMAGTVFTALVQSSSATTGVILALASQGLMTLPAALAIALGANLGSCATALLASWGKPAEARQAAMVHVIFNGVGVLLWVFLLPFLATLVTSLSNDLPRQIANAHTLFNILNTLLMIWFTVPMARAAQWLVPSVKPAQTRPAEATSAYLDQQLLETPSLALDRVRLELGNMGSTVLNIFDKAEYAVLQGTRQDLETTAARDQEVNNIYLAIVDYTRQLARHEMTLNQTETLENCLSAANYLESAGDIISTSIVTQGLRRLEHQLTIEPDNMKLFHEIHRFVAESFRSALKAFTENNSNQAEAVIQSKSAFQKLSLQLQEQLRKGLLLKGSKEVRTFQMEIDLISQYQRLHYLARRLAKLSSVADSKD